MKIIFLFSLVFIVLTGCSTFVNYPDATPVPDAKLGSAYSKYQTPTDETARIIVVRDTGPGGFPITSQFFINGELVAKMRHGQSITLYMKPGEYSLGFNAGFLKSANEKPYTEQSLKVTPGETYYYRIGAAPVKGWELEKVSLN